MCQSARVFLARLFTGLCLITAVIAAAPAIACPSGQYNACIAGICACVPNSGAIVNSVNPLPDTLTVLGGVVHGNIAEVSKGIGGLIIKGTCSGCAIAAGTVLSKNDKAFVETVIGRGWLVFVTTGSPSLVLADAATSVAKQYELTHPAANPLQAPAPVGRTAKRYQVPGALCAVKSETQVSVAGWVEAPTFKDGSGKIATFPGVDLQPGDTLDIEAANKECPAPPTGQTALTKFSMKYSYSTTSPAPGAGAMKYFFVGNFLSNGA